MLSYLLSLSGVANGDRPPGRQAEDRVLPGQDAGTGKGKRFEKTGVGCPVEVQVSSFGRLLVGRASLDGTCVSRVKEGALEATIFIASVFSNTSWFCKLAGLS